MRDRCATTPIETEHHVKAKQKADPDTLHCPYTRDLEPIKAGGIYFAVETSSGSSPKRYDNGFELPTASVRVLICTRVIDTPRGFHAVFRDHEGCTLSVSWDSETCPRTKLFASVGSAHDYAAGEVLRLCRVPDEYETSIVDDIDNHIAKQEEELKGLRAIRRNATRAIASHGSPLVTQPSRSEITELRRTGTS